MSKATYEQLSDLHGQVASGLSKMVKEGDLKAIEKAIAFLKNNNITADPITSSETKDLFVSIQEMTKDKEGTPKMSVEDILAMHQ